MSLAIETLPLRQPQNTEAFRWSGSLVIALGLHAAIALLLLHWHTSAPPSMPTQTVTMIDLAPLPAPPQPVVQPQPLPIEPPPPLIKPEVKPVVKPHPVERQVVTHPVAVPIPAPAPTEASPPQQSAPPPPAAAQPRNDALDNYRAQLAAYLARYKRYPHASQVKGEEGTVLVRFTLDRRGGVSGVAIDRGSGHPLLDEEVLALLRRAAPMPPMPASMPENEREFSVPVSFSLR